MANRNFDDLQALEKELVVIAGSFAPNGSSAPTAVTGKGVASVARSSAGLFLVTLDDLFVSFLNIQASLALASADDKFVQVGAVSVSSKTFEIRVWDVSGAAVSDISAAAGNVIYFAVMAKNSGV